MTGKGSRGVRWSDLSDNGSTQSPWKGKQVNVGWLIVLLSHVQNRIKNSKQEEVCAPLFPVNVAIGEKLVSWWNPNFFEWNCVCLSERWVHPWRKWQWYYFKFSCFASANHPICQQGCYTFFFFTRFPCLWKSSRQMNNFQKFSYRNKNISYKTNLWCFNDTIIDL